MIEILTLVISAVGFTQLIVFGSIFYKIRPSWTLFNCPQCMGFHIGYIFLCLGYFTSLWNFPITIMNGLIFGCIVSLMSVITSRYF